MAWSAMKRRIALVPGAVPAALTGACAGIQSPLAPASDQAFALHDLLILMTAVCGLIYLLVIAGLVWSVLRARQHAKRAAAAPVDDSALDRSLIATAAIIVTGLTVLIFGSFLADRALLAARAEKAMMVRVTGHQWWWRIEYRNPATGRWVETANELHLPLGRTTRVELASNDVIHSFWVPNVSGKIDMIPGRRNMLDLTPRRSGWFRGACAEFCGAQHAHMALDVRVDDPAAFDAWLAGQAEAARKAQGPGEALFGLHCGSCHAVRGTPANGRAGPDLTHFAARRSIAAGTLPMTRGALQGWIAQPQALKPGTAMPAVPLRPAEADAVASYLAALR